MLLQRTLVVVILLPVGLALIFTGGILFGLTVALILSLAVWEFAGIFRQGGFQPSGALMVAGVLLIVGGRYAGDPALEAGLLVLAILAAMAFHLLRYEGGRDQAASDLAVTLAGMVYIGWLGSYFISLRDLEGGEWWILLVLPAIWLADSGAYFIGRRFGRRKLSPRLSPKKTWEGYLGGVAVGLVGTLALGALWTGLGGPEFQITWLHSLILGGVLATVTTLGDLGESMIKRQFGVKDSGSILPGHGGAFDRIDSWLWGAPIGYYLIVGLFLV